MAGYLVTAFTTTGRYFEQAFDAPSKRHALALRDAVEMRGGRRAPGSGNAWRLKYTNDDRRALYKDDRLWHYERWNSDRCRYIETGTTRRFIP